MYIFSYEETLVLQRAKYTVYEHRLHEQEIGLKKMTSQGKCTRIEDLAEHFLPRFLFDFQIEESILLLEKK